MIYDNEVKFLKRIHLVIDKCTSSKSNIYFILESIKQAFTFTAVQPKPYIYSDEWLNECFGGAFEYFPRKRVSYLN